MARHTWTSKCLILSTPLFCSSIYWKHELSSLRHSLVLICESLIFQTVLKSLITNTCHCQRDCHVPILLFSPLFHFILGECPFGGWETLGPCDTSSNSQQFQQIQKIFTSNIVKQFCDKDSYESHSFVRLTRCLCSLFYGSTRDSYSRQSYTSSKKCR